VHDDIVRCSGPIDITAWKRRCAVQTGTGATRPELFRITARAVIVKRVSRGTPSTGRGGSCCRVRPERRPRKTRRDRTTDGRTVLSVAARDAIEIVKPRTRDKKNRYVYLPKGRRRVEGRRRRALVDGRFPADTARKNAVLSNRSSPENCAPDRTTGTGNRTF